MLLAGIRLVGLGPFEDISISFVDADGAAKHFVMIFGGEGVGKSSLLQAITTTRPGHTVAQLTPRGQASPPFAVADWLLGDDDPARPHPLRVVGPHARLTEPEDVTLLRRKEQTLFDRRAIEGGFGLLSLSGARWFSRSSTLLSAPERTILRYDVRASANFDDATRADLTRETKQVLSFAAVSAALALQRDGDARFVSFDEALREVLGVLLEVVRMRYLGVDPARLEPIFTLSDGREVDFDDLPRSARHLVAFGALSLRVLGAAYPERDARESEGVVLIDDIELHQDPATLRALPSLLKEALPRVQWIVTSSSPSATLGCESDEVLALRRAPTSGEVVLYEDEEARIH